MGRIYSAGASGPVEGSGAAKPGAHAILLTHGYFDLVFPYMFLNFPLNPESVIAMFAG